MRFEGVLIAWDPEAGRGEIQPAGGGAPVPVGLAAFPMDGDGPRLDEPLSFEIVSGREGRKEAVRLQRLHRLPPALREATGAGRQRTARAQKQRRLTMGVVGAVLVVLLGTGWFWRHAVDTPHDVPAALRR